MEVRGLNVKLNEKIGAWLLIPGHTKHELASLLGISHQTLNNRLDGTYDWQWSEIGTLAALLECPIESLR